MFCNSIIYQRVLVAQSLLWAFVRERRVSRQAHRCRLLRSPDHRSRRRSECCRHCRGPRLECASSAASMQQPCWRLVSSAQSSSAEMRAVRRITGRAQLGRTEAERRRRPCLAESKLQLQLRSWRLVDATPRHPPSQLRDPRRLHLS